MISKGTHRPFFDSARRPTQSLCNDRCQNILYKSVFEHFKDPKSVAALLLASKSFQNSSFGANFIVNFLVDTTSIRLFETVLLPSSCFSLQLVPSLHIDNSGNVYQEFDEDFEVFIEELAKTKYLPLQLRSLSMDFVTNQMVHNVFGNSNSWSRLQTLNLQGSQVDEPVMELISETAVHLSHLDLSDCVEIDDACLQHLVKLSAIRCLKLYRCIKVTTVGLEHISKCSGIVTLDLINCPELTDDGVEHLSKLSHITSLDLSRCSGITDVGVGHISKLSNITSLELYGCPLITDVGLEHVSKLESIESLNLASCGVNITGVGLEHISKLSNITSLDFYGCPSSKGAKKKLEEDLPKCRIYW